MQIKLNCENTTGPIYIQKEAKNIPRYYIDDVLNRLNTLYYRARVYQKVTKVDSRVLKNGMKIESWF
jgi:hypothetical protein